VNACQEHHRRTPLHAARRVAGEAVCLGLILCSAARPDQRMNQADNASPNLGNFTTESETSHAVFGSTIVAGWNDSRQTATTGVSGLTSISRYAYSTDGGNTWTDAGLISPPAGFVSLGDPSVAVDNGGNFYYAALLGDASFNLVGLTVSQSPATSSPVSFGPAVRINGLGSGSASQDKELIAVDNGTFGNRVYVVWTEFQGVGAAARILFTYSTSTSSLAFATPVALTGFDAMYHGAMPAVAPNGDLYLAWGRFIDAGSGITGESIQVMKSTDGGVTFSPVQTIATPAPTPDLMTSGGSPTRTRGFPYIAIDQTFLGSPTSGYVYVVYQAKPSGVGTDRSDVFFQRSTDGGATWSAPRCINKAPAVTIGGDNTDNDNWQPSISVSPLSGQITVSFYDRREDAANTQIKLYQAVSTDGGLTWFNSPVSGTPFTPSAGYDPLTVSTYMGDYNFNSSVGANVQLTWGDARNACSPPSAAPNPCSPAGRGDQDAYFDGGGAVLSGPDLFITPWGYVTGIGPLWQSPDVFVVDASGFPVNAQKGVINNLRARVKNIGSAAATGAVIHFKFVPAFVGVTAAAFEDIGTVTVSLNPGDTTEVPIAWDLTNLADTNGGIWPNPLGTFDHFCVQVTIELVADVNQANNFTQSNFFDVLTAASHSPVHFMIGNPFDRAVEATLLLDLPRGYRAAINGFAFDKPFRLAPREIRAAEIQFQAPKPASKAPLEQDQVAHVSMQIGAQQVGGISFRLAATEKRQRGWERLVPGSRQQTFQAVLAALAQNQERIALADEEKGLIQTVSIPLDASQLRGLVKAGEAPAAGNPVTGRYLLSFHISPSTATTTRVLAGAVILVNGRQAVITGGKGLASNGTLELRHLDQIVRLLSAKP
jgi:hypothetical protein